MFNNITQNSTGNISVATAGNLIGTPPVVYDPGMMTYDGSTGFYSKDPVTYSGNKITAIVRFNRPTFSGAAALEYLPVVRGPTPRTRVYMAIYSSDYATTERAGRLLVLVEDSAGTKICRLLTTTTVIDGSDHLLFFSFDADTGTAMLYLDGVDDDDATFSVRAETTGTLDSGASGTIEFGTFAVTGLFGGEMGYCGYADTALSNPTDFYHPTNGLQELDTSTWTEWGSQPLVFSPDGKLDTNNLGSIGALTKTGTITGPA